jgi:acyl dehydratase
VEIDSRYTGTELKPLGKTVNARETMNYAAAINDDNPLYFDDERPEGVIAPPMYAVALTWPLIANIWNHIDADGFPKEIFFSMVHYTEHLQFFGSVSPGDTLEIKGRIAAILPHRAGTHIVLRLDAVKDEKLLFTEHIGGMLRGVECKGSASGGETLPVAPEIIETVHKQEKKIFIDTLAAYVYDGCSGIHFPIHTSPKFARSVGLPNVIYQGTATLAHAVKEIISSVADCDPSRLKAVSCRFTGMVKPLSNITVRYSVSGKNRECFFEVLNAEGARAISNGYALLTEKK